MERASLGVLDDAGVVVDREVDEVTEARCLRLRPLMDGVRKPDLRDPLRELRAVVAVREVVTLGRREREGSLAAGVRQRAGAGESEEEQDRASDRSESPVTPFDRDLFGAFGRVGLYSGLGDGVRVVAVIEGHLDRPRVRRRLAVDRSVHGDVRYDERLGLAGRCAEFLLDRRRGCVDI